MRRASYALALALLLALLHLSLRALGLVGHTSAIAGMPIGVWSLPIAALYVLAYIGAVVVAPLLAIAATLEVASHVVRRRSAPRLDG